MRRVLSLRGSPAVAGVSAVPVCGPAGRRRVALARPARPDKFFAIPQPIVDRRHPYSGVAGAGAIFIGQLAHGAPHKGCGAAWRGHAVEARP